MARPPRHSIDDWLVPLGHETGFDDDETAATVLMDGRQLGLGEDARTPPAVERRSFDDEALVEDADGSLVGDVARTDVEGDDEGAIQTTPVLVLSLVALALVAAAIAIAPLLLL